MTSEIYWINEAKIGEKRIGTMARPRGNDWLSDEIKGLKIRKVDCLVSLLEQSEIEELELNSEEELCEKWDIQFINFPILDFNTPKNEHEFLALAEALANKVEAGKRVVIHCRMGIGRSSTLAAAILIKLGYEGANVFDVIGQYRKLKVPDTEEQKNWILSLEKKLKR